MFDYIFLPLIKYLHCGGLA